MPRPADHRSSTSSSPPERSPCDDQLAAFRSLHLITKQVHESLDLTATLDAVVRGVVDVAGFGVAVVNLARPDDSFEAVSVAGDEGARATLLGTRESAERWQNLLERSQRLGNLRFIDHRCGAPLTDDVFTWVPDLVPSDDADAWHPLDALFAPLTAPSGEWIGVLSVDLPVDGRRPGPVQLEILELFADQAAIAIEHARIHSALQTREEQARYAATHDYLTGLANRALLMSAAEEMSQRPGSEVAVLLIDLDRFKLVNDSAGHRAGDEVLRAVADRLRQCVRDTDVLARTGGDEFVVVLSGTDVATAARSLAARLQDALSRPVQGRFGVHQVGASIGLAVSATPARFSDLLSEADAAMYAEKRAGARGEVCAGTTPA